MDGSHFDTLARTIAHSGTRRRLVSLLLALPLGGVLVIAAEAGQVVAERPLDRVQRRTKQRNRKQRNQRSGNNINQNNKTTITAVVVGAAVGRRPLPQPALRWSRLPRPLPAEWRQLPTE